MSRETIRKGGNQRGRGRSRAPDQIGRGTPTQAPSKKESILNLKNYLEKKIQIKFLGGREVVGILKGYDALNFVLDQTEEVMPNIDGAANAPLEKRNLGLVVCRGTAIGVISPFDGMEKIPNPFINAQ